MSTTAAAAVEPHAPDTGTIAVEFDRVSFAFDDHVVLREISFRVPRGSMCIDRKSTRLNSSH